MRNFSPTIQFWARILLFLTAIYFFLCAIDIFSIGVRELGQQKAEELLQGMNNPFAGLAAGILATVLVQSSSVTTSLIVGMVGTGALPLACAVPMVMGANIGTSITNTLVSLGHVTQDSAFRRAFAGATVHDIFNLLTVAILLPLELLTHFLQHTAELLVEPLQSIGRGGKFPSPVKAVVKAFAKGVESVFHDGFGLTGAWLSAALFAVAIVFVVVSLIVITKNMRHLLADRIEEWLNRILKKRGYVGLGIGAVITALVQSSSITTSLLVPMFGAGVLKIEAGFPIMLGANIGTTVTALIAALVAGPAGLTIALVHLLFNLTGTLIFFPLQFMRRIPIRLSEMLADITVKNRIWAFVYIATTFVLIPVLGIILWRQ